MKRLIIIVIVLTFLVVPVSAMEYTAPKVPEIGEKYMPEDTQTFSEGLWYILKNAIKDLQPDVYEASRICLSILAVIILVSVIQNFYQSSLKVCSLTAVVAVGTLLIQPTGALIDLGSQTITQISEYSKMLIPVITAALAAQGGVNTSTALYVGTTFFCTVLTTLISKLLIPMVYIFLCFSIVSNVIPEETITKLKSFFKWLIVWSLKTILYIFTGYLTITGVVSGGADASALKAAKLTISGFVPVIGSILSDASEAVLVGANTIKHSIGIYGVLAVLAVWIGPFLRIGIQYLMIRLTSAIGSVFGSKETSALVQDFSDGMGLVLAMTGTICVMLLISIICFMKGLS